MSSLQNVQGITQVMSDTLARMYTRYSLFAEIGFKIPYMAFFCQNEKSAHIWANACRRRRFCHLLPTYVR